MSVIATAAKYAHVTDEDLLAGMEASQKRRGNSQQNPQPQKKSTKSTLTIKPLDQGSFHWGYRAPAGRERHLRHSTSAHRPKLRQHAQPFEEHAAYRAVSKTRVIERSAH
jgi:hypothetical protein